MKKAEHPRNSWSWNPHTSKFGSLTSASLWAVSMFKIYGIIGQPVCYTAYSAHLLDTTELCTWTADSEDYFGWFYTFVFMLRDRTGRPSWSVPQKVGRLVLYRRWTLRVSEIFACFGFTNVGQTTLLAGNMVRRLLASLVFWPSLTTKLPLINANFRPYYLSNGMKREIFLRSSSYSCQTGPRFGRPQGKPLSRHEAYSIFISHELLVPSTSINQSITVRKILLECSKNKKPACFGCTNTVLC